MEELLGRIQARVKVLPAGLQAHIYRVRDIAVELARCHGIDQQRAGVSMLAHDVARAMPDRELLRRAHELGLPVGTVERSVPVILHGPVGAELLAREDGLDDRSLHQAVCWHTTAHPSLDELGKLVFLADKLDPQKIGRYPYLAELRELALADLDRAMLEFLTRETISMASRGELVHPMVTETRNQLLTDLRFQQTSPEAPSAPTG